jgi:methylmalonyl-CoA mutase N-terminal domain/subunit
MGGMIPAIERGFPQREIAQASYEYQREIERGEQVIVGVNKFTEEGEASIDVLQIDESAAGKQVERLEAVKRRRSAGAVTKALSDLRRAAEGRENTTSFILDAVRAYATVGEICGALKDVFGSYTETSVL